MSDAYDETRQGVVLIERGSLPLLRVSGRSPEEMLKGMVTGALPPALQPVPESETVLRGRMTYSTILTPKGRMVTDLRIGRLPEGEAAALLLAIPREGIDAARTHLTKYLPPRFATVEAPAVPTECVTLVGPASPQALDSLLPDHGLEEICARLEEDECLVVQDGSELGLHIVRSSDVRPLAFELMGERSTLAPIRTAAATAELPHADEDLWTVLRIERGRPAFGLDMGEDTLLPEAGIQDRAVDHTKGCYTGQEVVVRIRDRGHVNRHLRGLLLGPPPLPEPGTPLYEAGGDRPVGEVRSSGVSPRLGQGIALAYVRREIEPPARLRMGSEDGAGVEVRALTDDQWDLDAGARDQPLSDK